MSFMQVEITQKGALYSAECDKCGATMYSHEWAHDSHNDRRDAMQDGSFVCGECGRGHTKPETFAKHAPHYAGRLSAPGYMDCTEWQYETCKRRLERSLRAL